MKELAAYIKIKEKTLYHLVSTRAIPHYRVNKLVRFSRSEVDKWLESKKVDPFKHDFTKRAKSGYNFSKGKPGHLTKEVIRCCIKEARSGT